MITNAVIWLGGLLSGVARGEEPEDMLLDTAAILARDREADVQPQAAPAPYALTAPLVELRADYPLALVLELERKDLDQAFYIGPGLEDESYQVVRFRVHEIGWGQVEQPGLDAMFWIGESYGLPPGSRVGDRLLVLAAPWLLQTLHGGEKHMITSEPRLFLSDTVSLPSSRAIFRIEQEELFDRRGDPVCLRPAGASHRIVACASGDLSTLGEWLQVMRETPGEPFVMPGRP